MSASVQPAQPTSSWRPVVVGTVAVLAIGIGVAAGSFMLTSRAAGMGAAAEYVPADAPFYIEGGRIVLQTEAGVSRDGDRFVEQPRQVRALELATGEVAWEHPIAEMNFRGPPPP